MSGTKKVFFMLLIFSPLLIIVVIFVAFIALTGPDTRLKEFMSRTEATNMIDFPLVDSASNISDDFYMTGLNHNEEFIRLTVAKSDLDSQISQAITNTHDRISGHPAQYVKQNIDFSEIARPDNHPNWWSPEKITHGFCIQNRDGASLGPREIWADQDTGTLFVFEWN